MVENNKFLFFLPRILSIAFILFLSLFSLDIFGQGYNFWETIVGLFMHNILLIILTIFLVVFWKKDFYEAIVFSITALFFIVKMAISILRTSEGGILNPGLLIIIFPLILIATLFLISGIKSKKKSS